MSGASYFILRRLHSLLGVFPLGVFLFNHLLTNSTAAISARFFEEKVALIHMLGPLLPLVEAAFIFIPLALHIALGVYIATQARLDTGYSYARNWFFILQRWTGWVALAFITYHVIHLRFLHDMHAEPFSIELAEMFGPGPMGIAFILFYLIGGLSVVFHFANGLCTFCMSWGITVNARSQRFASVAAAGIGAVLTLMLVTSIAAFTKLGHEYAAKSDAEKKAFVEELLSVHKHGHSAPEAPAPVKLEVKL